jgi:hypothetical protein
MTARNPAGVYAPAAARSALIVRLYERLRITARRLDRNAESLTGQDLDEITDTIHDARLWLDSLGALRDGTPEHEIEGGRDIQPRVSFLESLAREALTVTENARSALTELVAQFDAMPPIPPAGQPDAEES